MNINEAFKQYLGRKIVSKQTTYTICELEYYMKSSAHNDPYVHCDKEQLNNETFYFHRIKNKGFKEGNFKGVDITIGNVHNSEYGGMLIRSIMRDGTIIEGPCLVVQELMRSHGDFAKVKDFHEEYIKSNPDLSIYNKASELYITDEFPLVHSCHCSPRVGLKLKGDDLEAKIQYIMRSYRGTTMPSSLKKQKVTIILEDTATSNGDVMSLDELSKVKTWRVGDITNLYNAAMKAMTKVQI
jgi:hypothetical protein